MDPNFNGSYGALFENDIFCAATATFTNYASQITGFPNAHDHVSFGTTRSRMRPS